MKAANPGRNTARYHHGDLRNALIEAALELIAEQGPGGLSMREIAKRAGVSPAAPFRHFTSRTALLTAVAEQGMEALGECIRKERNAAPHDDSFAQFRAYGLGFLRWALANPTHFELVSNRSVIEFEASRVGSSHRVLREEMTRFLEQAEQAGQIAPGSAFNVMITGRALAYGLARMFIDGQFPSWGLAETDPLCTATAMLDHHLTAIARPA